MARKAFTLIELIIIVAILVITASAVLSTQTSFLVDTYLNTKTDEFIQNLKLSQSRAKSRFHNDSWSIYLDTPNNQFTLFKGSDYGTRDNAFDILTSLPDSLSISDISLTGGGSTITFDQASGYTSTDGTITFSNNQNNSSVITINNRGLIALNQTSGPTAITIFNETFPNTDTAWNGSIDTAQDQPSWQVIQGNGDNNDIQITTEAVGTSPSAGGHLTFEDADEGFQTPEQFDLVYHTIDLSGYNTVTLKYYWQSDDLDLGEGLRVAYSTDTTNGIDGTWVQLAEYLDPTDDLWSQASFSIPDAAALNTFTLRFSSKQDLTNEHLYIDDITLTGISN